MLLTAHCWEGAYYLGGYAVECALKACIAKRTERHEFPDLEKAKASYTHSLDALIVIAQLDTQIAQADPGLKTNWNVVRNWSEKSRYQRPSEAAAGKLLEAIKAPKYGVFRWLKRHW